MGENIQRTSNAVSSYTLLNQPRWVFPRRRFTPDDWPYTTELILEEGAAGKTDVAALVVMDGIQDAKVGQVSRVEGAPQRSVRLWFFGHAGQIGCTSQAWGGRARGGTRLPHG